MPLTTGLMPGYWRVWGLVACPPVSSLGVRMDDHTTRIAVRLHLGTPLCQPHICHHCGCHVDALTMIVGSAMSKAKVIFRGMLLSMPSYIYRSLATVNVLSTLEPLAYADHMASDPTVVLLPHGSLASDLFGTFGMDLYLPVCERR